MRIVLFILSCIIFQYPHTAQTNELFNIPQPGQSGTISLTISDAVLAALQNRYELSIAEQNIKWSEDELGAAKSELCPRIDIIGNSYYTKTIDDFEPVEVSFDVMGISYKISPTKSVPKYRSSTTVAVTQKLYSGGRITSQIQGAAERFEKSRITKKAETRKIMLSVINACWNLKKAEKLVNTENEALRQSEIIFNTAKTRYEKGAVSRLERDKAEAELIRVRLNLIQLENSEKIAADTLLTEMGIIGPGSISIILSDEPDEPASTVDSEIRSYIETALSERPEILQIKKDIKAKEADIKAAQSGYYPQVNLRGNYNWVGYDRNELNKSWEDIKGDYWSVSLSAEYNLFEGFLTKRKISQALTSLNSARFELHGIRKKIINEVKQAYNKAESKHRETESAKRNITLAEKNLDAVLKEYELGKATVDKVADYNISLAEARKRYIITLIDLEIAKAELKWAKGDSLP